MNLITDPWIPVTRQDGSFELIRPDQIAEKQNSVMEIKAPRPDFQGALYQFFIGLLQTCFAPEDEDEWEEYWQEMPKDDELQAAFAKVQDAFELDNPDGPAFMQDFSLPDGETKNISVLLIEAPGGKTLKDNLDHFIKRDQVNSLCPTCTATALFTLQANAPSGGVGHRVSLRGGGPLTTLVLPITQKSNLWNRLWLNVLNQEEIMGKNIVDGSVLPWLVESHLSDKGQITAPGDTHELQMYWGMPRRIRLGHNCGGGSCDLCGLTSSTLYQNYRTKNYGTNYDGAWLHPLTPYRIDPKKEKIPLSLKGQKGGLGYRHWLGLTLQDNENGDSSATVVRFFREERALNLDVQNTRLWCFGFDMDNMKARCWYDSQFPLLRLNKNQQENIIDWGGEFIRSAKAVVKILRENVKAAWFKRPKDAKGDMSMIDNEFWQATEPEFYQLLHGLALLPGKTRLAPATVYRQWFKCLEKNMFRIFEKETLNSVPEDLDMKRIITARKNMQKQFYINKEIKNLSTRAKDEEGGA